MFRNKSILLTLVVVILSSLACSIPFGDSGSPEGNIAEQAATAVAGTLTALAPVLEHSPEIEEDPPVETPEPDVIPTDMIADPVPVIKSTPDELRIAMADSDGNLLIWQEGGSLTEIVGSGSVSDLVLSPDGEWIVYTTSTSDGIVIELWAIKFDGSDQKLLVTHDDFMAMPIHPDFAGSTIVTIAPYMMDFIPGTHTLVFNTYPQFEGPGLMDNKDLWYIDVDTGERRSFLSPGQAGHFYFSPDGTQMALVTPDRIDLINTDGSNRRFGVLTYPFVLTYSEYAFHANPIWAADSSFLRVIIPPQDSLGDPSAPTNIYHLPTDGSPASLLTSVIVAPLQRAMLAPDVSHFAFIEEIGDPGDGNYSLKLSDLSGGTPVEFYSGSLGFGSWAPDSSHFYFYQSTPNQYFIGQREDPGVIGIDSPYVMDFDWITSDRFIFKSQSGDNVELQIGTLSSPSTLIANLGSGPHFAQYDFVHP